MVNRHEHLIESSSEPCDTSLMRITLIRHPSKCDKDDTLELTFANLSLPQEERKSP
jgi:hypothetical protein